MTGAHERPRQYWLIPCLVLVFNWPQTLNSLHLSGKFSPSDSFFHFLAKFGFQKTETLDKDATQGYIYGNITYLDVNGSSNFQDQITFTVLDRANFLEYYGNRSNVNHQLACQKMFHKINYVAYDASCHDDGEQDFLRSVPCPSNSLCLEEDNAENVVSHSQFTFRIQDLYQARFWYLSFVACRRNSSTCHWDYVSDFQGELLYDIYLVNGNPERALHKNIFKYQFSNDQQDLFQVYVFLLLVYTILTPLQLYAVKKQEHPISRLLACGLITQFMALLCICCHYTLLAFTGNPLHSLAVFGELLEIISESIFIMLLMLLALGWALTRQELTLKKVLLSLWFLYNLVSCLLYFWVKSEVDLVEDIEEYATLPGIMTLCMRLALMVAFVVALRDTMTHEFDPEKLNFFLHFGAAALVWFNYLPLLAIVALQVSALWREKFLTGVSYSVDTFAYALLMHLLWPGRSQQYFLLAVQKTDNTEELEVLCQAANHINESGGESGGEYWLNPSEELDNEEKDEIEIHNGPLHATTDLVVI